MQSADYERAVAQTVPEMNSQGILDAYGITEYSLADLVSEFNQAIAFKREQESVFKVLDAADHSDIWKVYNQKLARYIQTPVNNPITIIKEATKASIMPTAYSADFKPLSINARELADTANRYMQMKWEAAGMDDVNSDAADYAYLHGTSGVLFGWDADVVDAMDSDPISLVNRASQIQAKAFHPSNIFPDPGASTVEEMRYLFFAERKSKEFLKGIPRFQQALQTIENATTSADGIAELYRKDSSKQYAENIVTFLTCYRRVLREAVDPATGERHTRPAVDIIYMAGREILDISKDITPNCIPFVPLYDERIPNNFWGVSKCYKVLSMVLTLNMLDSTEATAYFQNQNPTEFINSQSGINIEDYQRHRQNPERAFFVNGDPKAVQSYAERPDLPKNLDTFRQYLISQIQQVSGVDSAYLGRSYGSIQTTGGVEQAIDRATMRDNTRIKAIDVFIKKEVELMTKFYIYHGTQENFYDSTTDNRNASMREFSFNPQALIGRSDIAIIVSNAAPRSNASYETAAMKLFELQMKYAPAQHGYPDLITPEELIQWLNIPKGQQNVLVDRMRAQMQNMKVEEYMAVLTAVGTLTQGGMPPEQALQEVAAQIEQSSMGQLPASNPAPSGPMPTQ